MVKHNTVSAFAAFLVVTVLGSEAADDTAAKPRDVELENDYSSLRAIFDSFRDAHHTRNFRRHFHCLTPSSQRNVLWEIIFSSGLRPDDQKAEAKRIVDKYVGEPEKLRDEYYKRYRAKHGVAPP